MLPAEQTIATTSPLDRWTALLDFLRLLALGWLLLVGLWSGPAYGATLVWQNGLFGVEIALVVILLLSALRGRVHAPSDYPFLIPCLGVLALSALSALLRVCIRGTLPDSEVLLLWQHGEPMLRGLLLYLAMVGDIKFLRMAWCAALAGLLLQSGASIEQHFTHVTRWYADLDRGWYGGWLPVTGLPLHPTATTPAPRSQGMTSYINLTAAMLAASIPCWAIPAIFGFTRSRLLRLGLVAGALATTAGLWYTDSRGPMFAVGVITLLFGLLLSGRWRISIFTAMVVFVASTVAHSKQVALAVLVAAGGLFAARRRWRSRYLLPITLALAFAGSVQLVDAYLLHYQLSWRVSDSGLDDPSRLGIYAHALQTIKSSPWWGIGDRAVANRVANMPDVFGSAVLPRTQQNFHDQYLQWAASEGLFVAIAWTLLVCWTVLWCWRLFRASAYPPARALGLAAAAGLAIFLISNLVDAHFWRIEGGGFFWSLLAVTAATGKVKGEE